jgi:hypothetical protein
MLPSATSIAIDHLGFEIRSIKLDLQTFIFSICLGFSTKIGLG